MPKYKRKVYPTYWQQWVGDFAIRRGNEFNQPAIVYIERVSKQGDLIGFEANTNALFTGSPRQLIPFAPRLFQQLKWNWLLKERKYNVLFLTQCVRDGHRPN